MRGCRVKPEQLSQLSPRHAKAWPSGKSSRRTFQKSGRRILPLPGGEGRGEGVRLIQFLLPRIHRPCVIRQRMRRTFLQLAKNRVADGLRVAPQTGIPKAQFLDAARSQERFAFRIVTLLVRMTVTKSIQFDGQPCCLAKEIQVVNAFRMLAAEFVTAETPVTQPAPQE